MGGPGPPRAPRRPRQERLAVRPVQHGLAHAVRVAAPRDGPGGIPQRAVGHQAPHASALRREREHRRVSAGVAHGQDRPGLSTLQPAAERAAPVRSRPGCALHLDPMRLRVHPPRVEVQERVPLEARSVHMPLNPAQRLRVEPMPGRLEGQLDLVRLEEPRASHRGVAAEPTQEVGDGVGIGHRPRATSACGR